MVDAYGSLAKPVALDPFQNIVGVHWQSETHIAILWGPGARTTFVNDTETCSPPEFGGPFSGYPTPPHPVASAYLTSVDYYLGDSSFGQGILDVVVRKDNGWHGLTEDPVINGMPTLPAASSHGPWDDLWSPTASTHFDYDTAGINGHSENDLGATFSPASGAVGDIPLPNIAGFFKTGFTPSFGFRTRPFLGADAVCFTDGFINGTVRFYSETDTWIDTFPVPLESIVATYKGKTFRGMAAGQVESIISGVPLERTVWILCEKESVTA